MKRLSLLIFIAGALGTAGCVADWFSRNEEVGEHLQRGVSGQGQLGPVNRTENDQANEHGVPQTHP